MLSLFAVIEKRYGSAVTKQEAHQEVELIIAHYERKLKAWDDRDVSPSILGEDQCLRVFGRFSYLKSLK